MKRLFTFLLGMFAFSQLIFAQENHTPPHDDDVIKLLAIGNSFSEDGIENYLHELAAATNKKNDHWKPVYRRSVSRTACQKHQ